MPYGHASMLLLGEGSEATEPYNKYNKIRPHSNRSLQFDQKVLPLSFQPEKFDLFTATPARSADILNRGNLAIIIQHINMVRLFSVHKLSNVNRDPDEIRAIFIQYAGQSSVSTFKKEVDE